MKVLFNVNSKVSNLTAQNAQKNIKELPLAQEQNYTAGTAFKGTEAVKSVLKAQENMRVPKSVVGVISFKGNPAKNNNQIASIASEYQNLPKDFHGMYKIGGLSNVAGEAADAFKKEGMDIRTFIPYHSRFTKDNETFKADGGVFVHSIKEGVDHFERVDDPTTYELKEGEDYALVAGEFKTKYNPEKGEKELVSTPSWIKLTKTNISGSVPYLDEVDKSLTQKEDKYTLFELEQKDEKAPKVYVVHTEGLAKLSKAYGGDEGDAYFSNFDREYANFTRAIVGEILPKMNEGEENQKAFGDYNPAGYWLHDRFAFPAMLEASKRAADGDEYFSGLRMHATYHNPGRDYQGHYDNPLDFIKTIGAVEILDTLAQDKPEEAKRVIGYIEKIKAHRASGEKKKFDSIKDILKDDYKDLEAIFEPYIGQFKDELGSYNMSLIPHAAKEVNNGNFTHGTVSMNYGKEMINAATPEIALGITSILKKDEANMVNITNGSSAVNLGLDKAEFNGAPGLDALAKAENGYTPVVRKDLTTAEALDKVKKANTKWAINAVSEGFKQAKEIGKTEGRLAEEAAIKEFFFADGANSSSSIIGSMSPYEEGDKLFFGWGRGVEQKGIPTTLEAFKQFYLDESIDEETKKHTKLILGAGVWAKESNDWKNIERLMAEIAEIDGGKYANNVMYVNGRIPNKLAACADFTVLTSRYEPCGITPLESYSAGTPVISVATGGAPDFVKHGETGFLTKHAFYTKPETLEEETGIKAPASSGPQAIDDYRVEVLGAETKDCIVEALGLDNDKYKEMAFECFNQKIDWQENGEYNNGTSANDRYFGEAFGVKQTADGFTELSEEAHPTETMKSATGDIKTKAGDDGREDLAFEKLKRATIAEVETEETPAEETPAETNDKGSSSKKVATGVGIAAAIIALGVAIKKLFGGKDKKAKKAGFSKAKTPKAPKPSTSKAKTEAPAVKSEVKKEAKDFSKYLK